MISTIGVEKRASKHNWKLPEKVAGSGVASEDASTAITVEMGGLLQSEAPPHFLF